MNLNLERLATHLARADVTQESIETLSEYIRIHRLDPLHPSKIASCWLRQVQSLVPSSSSSSSSKAAVAAVAAAAHAPKTSLSTLATKTPVDDPKLLIALYYVCNDVVQKEILPKKHDPTSSARLKKAPGNSVIGASSPPSSSSSGGASGASPFVVAFERVLVASLHAAHDWIEAFPAGGAVLRGKLERTIGIWRKVGVFNGAACDAFLAALKEGAKDRSKAVVASNAAKAAAVAGTGANSVAVSPAPDIALKKRKRMQLEMAQQVNKSPSLSPVGPPRRPSPRRTNSGSKLTSPKQGTRAHKRARRMMSGGSTGSASGSDDEFSLPTHPALQQLNHPMIRELLRLERSRDMDQLAQKRALSLQPQQSAIGKISAKAYDQRTPEERVRLREALEAYMTYTRRLEMQIQRRQKLVESMRASIGSQEEQLRMAQERLAAAREALSQMTNVRLSPRAKSLSSELSALIPTVMGGGTPPSSGSETEATPHSLLQLPDTESGNLLSPKPRRTRVSPLLGPMGANVSPQLRRSLSPMRISPHEPSRGPAMSPPLEPRPTAEWVDEVYGDAALVGSMSPVREGNSPVLPSIGAPARRASSNRSTHSLSDSG